MTKFAPDTLLAPHFTWGELVQTGHRSLADANATASEDHLGALTDLALMLEAVRVHFGAPVIVHSGYRCPALNRAIGGSVTSQHMRGEAADFHVHGVALETVFNWIRLESGLAFGQVILEGVQAGLPTWVHLSLGEPWRPVEKSRMALTWSGAHGYRRAT